MDWSGLGEEEGGQRWPWGSDGSDRKDGLVCSEVRTIMGMLTGEEIWVLVPRRLSF